jgi:hypothetical protein
MSSKKSEVVALAQNSMEDRVRELEVENSRFQRLVAELLMKNQQLREAHLPTQINDKTLDRHRGLPHSE